MTVPSTADVIRRVACHIEFDLATPAVLALQVAVANTAGDILDERLSVTLDGGPPPQAAETPTSRGGRTHVIDRSNASRTMLFDMDMAINGIASLDNDARVPLSQLPIVRLTEADYAALVTKDPNTIYLQTKT